MKKKVFLKRFIHRNKRCIGIFFAFDEKVKSAVKSLNNITFSKTNKCFYLDDSEDNLKLILGALKNEVDVDISALTRSEFVSEEASVRKMTVPEPEITGKGILREEEKGSSAGTINVIRSAGAEIADLKHEDDLISFSSSDFRVSNHIPGREKTKAEIIPVHREIKSVTDRKKSGPVEFTVRENEGLLVIRFHGWYEPQWIDELKSYGRIRYDKARREWLLYWSKITCDSLADYFASQGIEVTVTRQVLSGEIKAGRKEMGDEIRSRQLGNKAVKALEALGRYLEDKRYSERTSKSYLPLLELFFKYYHTKDPQEITVKDITRFIHEFIIELGYSSSYQNQVVSAIKIWYEISGIGRVDPVLLERPRSGRALPKVFSKDEVKRILNAARNGKHKLLLWIVYSCGLRRSEIINIRLVDLDRDRKILHVKEGKGKVDRIVPVPDKVWEKIDEYIEGYAPRDFLFEGSGGGKYSVESVYQVFKQALRKAGIKRDVGVHSLRHSYATHLHESGLDIRYIQELLGHKSTKTTEIYTHISRRNLMAVRSPIEDLDVR